VRTSIVDEYVHNPALSAEHFNQLTYRRQTRQVNDDVIYVVISGLPFDVSAQSLGLDGIATT